MLCAPEPMLVVFSNSTFHGNYEQGLKLDKVSDGEEPGEQERRPAERLTCRPPEVKGRLRSHA